MFKVEVWLWKLDAFDLCCLHDGEKLVFFLNNM